MTEFYHGEEKRCAILPSMSLCFSFINVDLEGPNFNSVEIDKCWDHP